MFNKVLMIFLIVAFSNPLVFGLEDESTPDWRVSNKGEDNSWYRYTLRVFGCFSTENRTKVKKNVHIVPAAQVIPTNRELETHENSQTNSPRKPFEDKKNVSDDSEDTDIRWKKAVIKQRKLEGYQIIPVSKMGNSSREYGSRDDVDKLCYNVTDGDLTRLANEYLKGTFSSCTIGNYGKFFFRNDGNDLLFEIPEGTRWYARVNEGEVIGFSIKDIFDEMTNENYKNQPLPSTMMKYSYDERDSENSFDECKSKSLSFPNIPKQCIDLFFHEDWG